MGNIGTPELFVVLIVALLVLGPNRLPQAARSMGKAMAEFRRVTGGLQAEMRDAVSHLENEINSIKDDVSTNGSVAPATPAPYVFDPPAVAPIEPLDPSAPIAFEPPPMYTSPPTFTPPSTEAPVAFEPPSDAPPQA